MDYMINSLYLPLQMTSGSLFIDDIRFGLCYKDRECDEPVRKPWCLANCGIDADESSKKLIVKDTKMNLNNINSIDIHSHYDSNSKYDRGTSEVHRTSLDYIKRMYDAANIEIAFCSTFASVLSSEAVIEENKFNFTLSQELDWMYQWVVIEPHLNETFEQAQVMLKSKKCVGIKIHPSNHKYSLDAFGDRIFAFAADNGAIILIHPEENIADALSLADKYSESKLISAHMGSAEHVSMVECSKHGNVYLDTSGVASSRNGIIEYAVSKIGSDKILFGTDTYSSGFQKGRIEYALIPDKDKVNILRNNAIGLFKRNLNI